MLSGSKIWFEWYDVWKIGHFATHVGSQNMQYPNVLPDMVPNITSERLKALRCLSDTMLYLMFYVILNFSLPVLSFFCRNKFCSETLKFGIKCFTKQVRKIEGGAPQWWKSWQSFCRNKWQTQVLPPGRPKFLAPCIMNWIWTFHSTGERHL